MVKNIINNFKKLPFKLDILWFILFPIFNSVYFITNRIYESGFDLSLSLDRKIPLVSIFILPYVYWYGYMFIGYLYISIKDRRNYIRSLIGLFIGMWISYFIYFIFPTEMTRPIVTDGGILNSLIKFIYASDRPFNCFPSLHVLGTYFVMRYTKRVYNKWVFIYTQIVGVLIILSTIFTRQHFIVDILISIVMVEVIKIATKGIKIETIEKLLGIPYILVEKIIKKCKASTLH